MVFAAIRSCLHRNDCRTAAWETLQKYGSAQKRGSMKNEPQTATRQQLLATETGQLVTRIFEISRELRGDSAAYIATLTAIADTTGGSDATD
jgi:hypothetical protein